MNRFVVRLVEAGCLCFAVAACDMDSPPTGVASEDIEPDLSHVEDNFRADYRVSAIRVGTATVCAIGTPSQVAACWGRNDHGQLGNGTRESSSIPVSLGSQTWRSIDVAESHACGVRSDGAAYCWGANAQGQLGDGTTTERLSPVAVAGGRTTFVQVRLGITHSCAIEDAGAMYCWGDNDHGQLGNGEIGGFETAPVLVAGGRDFDVVFPNSDRTCALDVADAAYCWGIDRAVGTDVATPTPVPGALRYTQMSVTGFNTCGLTEAFELYCWGGEGNAHPLPTLVGTQYYLLSPDLLCAVDFQSEEEAETSCWDGSYEPVPVFSGVGWRGIGGGFRMSGDQVVGGTLCAANGNVELFCWGEGGEGQIGDGWTQDRAAPTPALTPGLLPRVRDLHVSAVTQTSITLTWTEVYVSGGQPARYRVKTGTNLATTWSGTVVCEPTIRGIEPGAQISCTAQGLERGTGYQFRLASYGVEDGVWVDAQFSNVAHGQTYPHQVTDLVNIDSSLGTITLRWTEVDGGAGEPASYRVKYGSPLGDWSTGTIGCSRTVGGTAIGEFTTCTVEGLEPSVRYQFQLASFRLVNGVWTDTQLSNVTSARTMIPPGGVSDLRVTAATSTSLTVTWTQVDDGTGNPARYRVKYGQPIWRWGGAATGCNVTGSAIGQPISCTFNTGPQSPGALEVQLMSYRVVGGAWVDARYSNLETRFVR
jgi:hypothetical protein